jgi:hypothetical protein
VNGLVTALLGDEPITIDQRRYLRRVLTTVLATLGAASDVVDRGEGLPQGCMGVLDTVLGSYSTDRRVTNR